VGNKGHRGVSAPRNRSLRITYIGGPTALLEFAGARFLTDPTFDPGGTAYPTPHYTLRKTIGPAVPPEALAPVDAVLLSHDHHFDNLDHAGRALLPHAKRVLTTPEGAARLEGTALGLAPWLTTDFASPGGLSVRVTGTPARHGPADADRGPVTGFVLATADEPEACVYVSGDTVWYDGVADVARRFPVRVALLFMGAARVPEVGPHHLTFTAAEAVTATRLFKNAAIVPVHFEGWAHYSESRSHIDAAFAAARLTHRLRMLEPGGVADFSL